MNAAFLVEFLAVYDGDGGVKELAGRRSASEKVVVTNLLHGEGSLDGIAWCSSVPCSD